VVQVAIPLNDEGNSNVTLLSGYPFRVAYIQGAGVGDPVQSRVADAPPGVKLLEVVLDESMSMTAAVQTASAALCADCR
jgi:hypothetical protein